jgi:TDG/mug DNA glycosylase family protein
VDTRLEITDFDIDELVKRLRAIQPSIIAFNGKKAASIYFDCGTRNIDYGRQTTRRDGGNLNSTVFVLPSTSGSAKKYWDLKHWRTVAEEFKVLRRT